MDLSLRYRFDAAALRGVSASHLQEQGYGKFRRLFEAPVEERQATR